jgi:hypothetical protein
LTGPTVETVLMALTLAICLKRVDIFLLIFDVRLWGLAVNIADRVSR